MLQQVKQASLDETFPAFAHDVVQKQLPAIRAEVRSTMKLDVLLQEKLKTYFHGVAAKGDLSVEDIATHIKLAEIALREWKTNTDLEACVDGRRNRQKDK